MALSRQCVQTQLELHQQKTSPLPHTAVPSRQWGRYQIILPGEQKHMSVNNLPMVVTWQCTKLESNREPQSHWFTTTEMTTKESYTMVILLKVHYSLLQ